MCVYICACVSVCLCVCMLSRFSRAQFCVTPWTVACQAPPSMGFSRQEYWSELPFPSPSTSPNLLQLYVHKHSISWKHLDFRPKKSREHSRTDFSHKIPALLLFFNFMPTSTSFSVQRRVLF